MKIFTYVLTYVPKKSHIREIHTNRINFYFSRRSCSCWPIRITDADNQLGTTIQVWRCR